MLFRYREPAWYGFGLRLGLKNLVRNGTRLGARKTIGKILQPVNSYTRFPEYDFFAESIGAFVRAGAPGSPLRILDVGSPKLFGLHLAYHTEASVYLTDISRLNLDEYVVLWNTIESQAKGRALFSQQDARNLDAPNGQFDVVYSMSVIEHIEQEIHEPHAIAELLRVLKPGGRLLLSVPMGAKYVEQVTSNFTYDADEVDAARRPHFFQRIFDGTTIKQYIVDSLAPYVDDLQMRTVFRRRSALGSRASRMLASENLQGLLGFTNPLRSLLYNRHRAGLDDGFHASYGEVRSPHDRYGDFLLSCRKCS